MWPNPDFTKGVSRRMSASVKKWWLRRTEASHKRANVLTVSFVRMGDVMCMFRILNVVKLRIKKESCSQDMG